jgi:hypothetical protein
MKNLLSIVLLTLVTGCSTTVPVKVPFPNQPDKGSAMVPCPPLKNLSDKPTLSEMSKTITMNYSTYYECAVKSDTWIEWYELQKANYEKAGK